jgi:hypothetical protein
MDPKLEKYYQHIMNDLLKNTIKEWDVQYFKPFWSDGKDTYLNEIMGRYGEARPIFKFPKAIVYLRNKFGARHEDIKYIWGWYVWHVKSTITGDYD